jgi:hypothetical protein
MTKYESRTPRVLAKYSSLDEEEVIHVLENFKGLFRKSVSTCDYGQHYYTLQLRYATRWLRDDADADEEEDPGQEEEPLEAQYFSTLLTFISEMVGQEYASRRKRWENIIVMAGAWIAATASIVAAIISLMK